MFTLFLSSAVEIDLPSALGARVYRPDRVRDPFLDDGAPPAWVAQLYFDSLAALDSPVRHEMRADFARFPPYRGRVTHYAMATEHV